MVVARHPGLLLKHKRILAVFTALLLIFSMLNFTVEPVRAVTYTKNATGAPSLTVGIVASGTYTNLAAPDNSYYALTEAGVAGRTNRQGLDIKFESWTPLNYNTEIAELKISRIDILLRGYVNTAGDTWSVQMYNFSTGAYDTVGLTNNGNIALTGTNTSFTVSMTSNADIQNHLDTSGNYDVRVVDNNAAANSGSDTVADTLYLDQLQVRFTGDSTPPAATWVGPGSGTYRGTITLQATATDNAADDSGIKKVEFWYKTPTGPWTLLGNGTPSGSTYSYNVNTTTWGNPDGDYNFRAIAYDNVDNTATVPSTLPIVTIDNTSPTVTGTNPASGQTGVALNTAVAAAFSENVSGISAGTFTVVPAGGGNALSGYVSYDQASKTATFSPDAPLSNSTQYTATLSSGITDQAGNPLGQYSWNFTTLAVIDNEPPTQPANLQATGVNDHQIDLSWTVSTDNVGVAGYEIWRSDGGAFIKTGTTAASNYSDSAGLAVSASYRYYVIAFDSNNNKSPASATVTGTTTGDTTPPSPPSGLNGTVVGGREVDLTWTAPTDNVGVAGYQIWRSDNGGGSFSQIGTSGNTLYNDLQLLDGKTYYYYVKAYDAKGNVSDPSNTVNKTTNDITAPAPPASLQAVPLNETQINLSWIASTDNVGVTQYQVYKSLDNVNFTPAGITTGTGYTVSGVTVNVTNYFYVVAYDAANNASSRSNVAEGKTVDTTKPTPPGAPMLTVVNANRIDLSWIASSDASGVSGYQIFRSTDGTVYSLAGTSALTSYSDTVLAAGTRYFYYITAFDAAGNISDPSGSALATTKYDYAPQVISVTPPDGEINMATGLTIKATFNQDMDAASLSSATLTVKPNGGSDLTGLTYAYDASTRTVSVAKTGGLSVSTNYIVTITTGVKNTSGLALVRDYSWSFTTASQAFRFPHGNYVASSSQCASCHTSHSAGGDRLVDQSSIKATCYVCHNGTQTQSNINVQGDFNHTEAGHSSHPVDQASPDFPAGSLSCNNCHNPHGDVDGSNNLYPKLMNTGRAYNGAAAYNQGNNVCWTCHGKNSTPLNIPGAYADHQTNWPQGTGHDSTVMLPSSNTQVKCSRCHDPHGSTIARTLVPSISPAYTNPVTGASTPADLVITGNDKSFCYGCHFDQISNQRTRDYWGKAINDASGHGANCQSCHNSHGTSYPNYLKSPYLKDSSTLTTYDSVNFTACTGCHTKFANNNYAIPLDNTGTSFYNNNISKTPEQKDLHYLHLVKSAKDGFGDAVCYDCHRPHGAISSENSSASHKVGFPTTSATATYYHDTQSPNITQGGGCALSCHGKSHVNGPATAPNIDGRYNNSGSAGGGGGESTGGQPCNSCHQNVMTSLSSSYHHAVSSDAVDYNGPTCLTCHVDHDLFSPVANQTNQRGNNLRTSKTSTLATNLDFQPGAQDGGLCLSCHRDQITKSATRPDGTLTMKAMSISNYGTSKHQYTVQGPFSDASNVNVNCSKCHVDNDTSKPNGPVMSSSTLQVFRLHGSSIRSVLSGFPSWLNGTPSNSLTEVAAGKGFEEKFCFKCHSGTTAKDVYGTSWTNTLTQNIQGQFTKTIAGSGNPVNPNQGNFNVHPITSSQGIHRYDEGSVRGWNSGANRHAECMDCHETHETTYNSSDPEGVSSTLRGLWGVSATPTFTVKGGGPGGQTLSTGYSFNASPAKQYEICFKCHSSYGFDTSPPASNHPAASSTYGNATTQPDIGQQFNPGNYATHPLFSAGANQPPVTANPSWGTSGTSSAGRKGDNLGLTNTFTDGWSSASLVKCTDCHGSSDTPAPRGPHGSTQKWILKKADPNTTITLYNGTKLQPLSPTYLNGVAWANANKRTAAEDNFCLNCHRADVYGYGSAQFPTTAYKNLSRYVHSTNGQDLESDFTTATSGAGSGKGNRVVTFGCLNCHGGREPGGIHGTNLGVGAIGTDAMGKRFMNGASWTGHTLGASAPTCVTDTSANSINSCTIHSKGTSNGVLTYSY